MQESDSPEEEARGRGGKGKKPEGQQQRGGWRKGKAGRWGTSYLGIIPEQPTSMAAGRDAGTRGVGGPVILDPKRHLGKRTNQMMLVIQTVL